jgi:MFS family permease
MNIHRKIIIFILLSLVSLFADMSYEGARSVAGAYMSYLGAPAIIAGALGIGEFLSYISRALSGFLVNIKHSVRAIWSLIIIGYIVNLGVIPFLALTGKWELAFLILLLERIGKGLRVPPRDIVLSEVTVPIGRGKGFGLHELMDQIGAVAGPLLISYTIARHGYGTGFLTLGIPSILAVALVVVAAALYIKHKSSWKTVAKKTLYTQRFTLFLIAVFFMNLGFLHWFLAGYHLSKTGLITAPGIALLYTVAMLTDALLALPLGYLFDKIGEKIITASPILALSSSLVILFSSNVTLIMIGVVLWGIYMAYTEVVLRAVIPSLVSGEISSAYGRYYIVQALGWGSGSLMIGTLYAYNKIMLIPSILGAEIASFAFITILSRESIQKKRELA